jgi:hypothetical protein
MLTAAESAAAGEKIYSFKETGFARSVTTRDPVETSIRVDFKKIDVTKTRDGKMFQDHGQLG